jgi:hypothetical protein
MFLQSAKMLYEDKREGDMEIHDTLMKAQKDFVGFAHIKS